VQVPRSNAGTSPRVVLSLGIVLSLGGGDDGRALAVGSTAVQYRGVDRGRDPGKLRRGRGGDRASTRGNGCGGGPRTPCGARTRCRCAVARKARTGLPWVSSPGGLGADGGGGPRALPHGKWASPEGECRNLRGVEPRKNGEGQKDPGVGRGLLAGIPEAQPAAPGLKGGRSPAYWTSHSRPQAGKWGAVPGEVPGTATGETGAKPHGLLREESGAAAKGARGPSGREISGPQGCPYPEGPTLTPPRPPAGGFGVMGGHLRESSPSRRGRPRKGLERGVACMELRWIPGDPRINPARRGGGRGASRGWKGMRPKGGGQAGVRVWGPTLPRKTPYSRL